MKIRQSKLLKLKKTASIIRRRTAQQEVLYTGISAINEVMHGPLGAGKAVMIVGKYNSYRSGLALDTLCGIIKNNLAIQRDGLKPVLFYFVQELSVAATWDLIALRLLGLPIGTAVPNKLWHKARSVITRSGYTLFVINGPLCKITTYITDICTDVGGYPLVSVIDVSIPNTDSVQDTEYATHKEVISWLRSKRVTTLSIGSLARNDSVSREFMTADVVLATERLYSKPSVALQCLRNKGVLVSKRKSSIELKRRYRY